MQCLTAAIGQQQQAGQHQVLQLQNQQAQILQSLQHTSQQNNGGQPGVVANANKILHIWDSPRYSGSTYEDPIDFLLTFETVGRVPNWHDVDIAIWYWPSKKMPLRGFRRIRIQIKPETIRNRSFSNILAKLGLNIIYQEKMGKSWRVRTLSAMYSIC